MKKEIITALLLLIIICAAFLNVKLLENVTAETMSLVDKATEFAVGGDWTNAKMAAEYAAEWWKKQESYTSIVLRNSEIDGVDNLLGELIKEIYSESAGGAQGAAKALKTRLALMLEIEKVKPGSIF